MELTLDDLAREVSERIQQAEVRQGNGQVSPFPDGRTLRYYTTIGLLDRPVAMRGRQAIYGDRHVHQAVAVKRLQAAGLSLGEIQERLAGLPTPELAQVAGADRSVVRDASRATHSRGRWWTAPVAEPAAVSSVGRAGSIVRSPVGARPAPPAPGPAQGRVATTGAVGGIPGAPATAGSRDNARWTANTTVQRALSRDDAGGSGAASPPPAVTGGAVATRADLVGIVEAATTLTAVPLGATATLLVPAGRPLTGADLDAIRHAAAPLTNYLAAAGLTDPRPDPKDRS